MTLVISLACILSLTSISGGILLLYYKKINRYLDHLLAFSAGVLLAVTAGELLPTAIELGEDAHLTAIYFLLGFLLLPLLSFFFPHVKKQRLSGWLLIIADGFENFADGLALAAAFSLGHEAGWILAAGILLHELPQEIGEFSLLYQRGFSRRQIIKLNLYSCFLIVLGALIFYWSGSDSQQGNIAAVSAMSAGYFFYLVATDLLPALFKKHRWQVRITLLLIFLLSLSALWLMMTQILAH